MKLADWKLVLIAVGLIGVLLIANPLIGKIIPFPNDEQFSQLYLLGPEYMAENYPSNIVIGQSYSVFVGVRNHLDTSAFYTLYVKLLNETDALPNLTSQTSTSLNQLYEYRFFIPDGENWASLFTFSVSNATIQANNSQINKMQINDVSFNVDKSTMLNSNSSTYIYQLLFELWLYNKQTGSFEFNNRYVTLRMNLSPSL